MRIPRWTSGVQMVASASIERLGGREAQRKNTAAPVSKTRRSARVALIVAALASTAFGQSLTWSERYDSGVSIERSSFAASWQYGGHNAVATDAVGNVVVGGSTEVGAYRDFLVVKYDASGGVAWRYRYDGGAGEEVRAVAIDGNGDVLATGVSNQGATGADFVTAKLSGVDGSEIWRRATDGGIGREDYVMALAVNGAGDVVLTGSSNQIATYFDYLTVKLSGVDGSEIWRRITVGGGNWDSPVGLALDGAGDVVVAGASEGGTTSTDYLTVKLSGVNGSEVWRQRTNGAGNTGDTPQALALTPSGEIVVTGSNYQASTNRDFLTVQLAGATGVELWRRTTDGGVAGWDEPSSLAADGAGDVLVTGRSLRAAGSGDFLTIKLAGASGVELWRRVSDGGFSGDDEPRSILALGGGDVLVTGRSPQGPAGSDFLTFRLAGSDGAVVWSRATHGGAAQSDQPTALGLDGQGRVVVVGQSCCASSFSGQRLLTAVLAASDGSEVWRATEAASGYADERASGSPALALGPGGRLAVAGTVQDGATPDLLVVQYDASGAVLWTYRFDGGAFDEPRGITTTAAGDVLVTGWTYQEGAAGEFLTVKLSGLDGSEIWRRVSGSGPNAWDEPRGLALDGNGDVVVLGRSDGAGGQDYLTLKLAGSDGSELWRSVIDSGVGSDDPRGLAVDSTGGIFLVGTADYLYPWGTVDYFTVKLDGSSGGEIWRQFTDGQANDADEAWAVAADPSGNAIVTGKSTQWIGGTGVDFLTVKLSGTSGAELWRTLSDGVGSYEEVRSLAVDGSGDVFVTGRSDGGAGNDDALTVKLSGVTGGELWRRAIDGGLGQYDEPVALAIAAGGEVVAVSRSIQGATGLDFLVVRLSGATGNELGRIAVGTPGLPGTDDPAGLALGAGGAIFVTGSSQQYASDLLTVKLTTASDTLPPSDPTSLVVLAPHTAGVWSNDTTVALQWSGATDDTGGSGLAGYSVEWNHDAVATPDANVDVLQAADPHSTTSPSLGPDGDDWYFHLRTCDVAGNCTATLHAGPFWIDTTAPSGLSALVSTSHAIGVVSGTDSISMSWSEPTDAGSGLGGYSWTFNGSASWSCESTFEAVAGTTAASSGALAAGAWYFHICARDNAGNWGPVSSAGPFYLTESTLPSTCALPFERSWGQYGSGAGQFARPFGVVASPGGAVYVADLDNDRVQSFDARGLFEGQWPAAGWPVSVAVDSHDHIVVSNLATTSVQMFQSGGALVHQWSSGHPYGLAVDLANQIYVVDDQANVVSKYDHGGNLLSQFGSTGTGPGQFLRAWGVAVAPDGDLFVTDANGHHVQRFTSVGVFLARWGSFGSGPGQLFAPTGIVVTPDGVVYLSEVGNQRVQAFTLEGFPLCAWGTGGTDDGQFQDPLNLSYRAGHLYVVDQLNHRIQKFGIDATGPSDPVFLASTSHSPGNWDSAAQVTMAWSSAADDPHGSGLAGYSVEWDHSTVSTPDAIVDVPHTADPHETTSAALTPDGDDWYFHLRTCDNAGNCTSAVHAGPFWIDTTAPDTPGTVTSSSHGSAGVPASEPDLEVTWGAAVDAGSGVDGYALALDSSPTWTCDQAQDVEETVLSATISGLPDGAYYFHACAVDRAGNWGAARDAGPFVVSSSAPSNDLIVYYTDYRAGQLRRVRANGTDDALVRGGLAMPLGLAVDPRAGKIYFSQAGSDLISRCNLDGTALENLVTGAGSPYEVALDLDGGKVYWAARAAGAIRRAGLDGSGVESVLAGLQQPAGVAFDRTWRKVYWSEDSFGPPGAAMRIGRMEADGSAVEVLLTLPGTERGYALDVDPVQRQVYWSDTSVGWGAIHRFDYDGTGDTVLVAGVAQAQLQLEPVSRHLFWSEEADRVRRGRVDGSEVVTIAGSGSSWGGNFWGVGLLLPEAAPVAVPQVLAVSEDTELPLRLRGFDPDDDPLTAWAVVSLPAHGTLSGTPPEVVYAPDPGYAGDDSFTFTVGDGLATSAPATVAITVSVVDDAPTDPTLGVPVPPESSWTNDATVTISWSGAADDPNGSGLAGYSVEWDHTAGSTPDAVVDIPHGADPHVTTSAPLVPDGDDWYFHLRTCDNAGNCTSAVHAGPFWIDTAAPGLPGGVTSPSHGGGLAVSDPTIDIAWGAAPDALSGVATYRYDFSGTAAAPACGSLASTGALLTGVSGNLLDGTWYAHACAVDLAGNEGPVISGGPYSVDTAPPAGLAVVSTSHVTATWSNENRVDFEFSGAGDPNGIAGYSLVFDQLPGTEPDATVDEAGSSASRMAVPDGSAWWGHTRACDVAGNCGVTVHTGPFQVDTQAPSVASGLASSSHDVGVASSDDTIEVSWSAASDQTGLSGLDGYALAFAGGDDDCDGVKDAEEDQLSMMSPPLADGEWWFHVCARDNAGNWGTRASIGPFVIDTSAAVVSVGSVADTGDGVLDEGEATLGGITQLLVAFDGAMADPPGNAAPEDVTNPANFRLYRAGANGALQTAACGAAAGDDFELPVASSEYLAADAAAVLRFAGSHALDAGRYRLLVCPTLEDGAGNAVSPFQRDFTVSVRDELGNPNLDADLAGWVITEAAPGSLRWSAEDAGEASSSGSAEVLVASGVGEVWGLSQCFELPAGPFLGRARVRVESATGGAPEVELRLDFYDAAACGGALVDSTLSPAAGGDTGGLWAALELERPSEPATSQSVLVTARVLGGAAASFTVRLDDLFFGRPLDLLSDGFETADFRRWSAVAPAP